MRKVSVIQRNEPRSVGRLSDGSDRQDIIITTYIVTLIDNNGNRIVEIFDSNPTDQQIFDRLDDGVPVITPVTKAALERAAGALDERWDRFKRWRIEATARGAPANIVTSLTTAETNAWNDIQTLITTWRTAT